MKHSFEVMSLLCNVFYCYSELTESLGWLNENEMEFNQAKWKFLILVLRYVKDCNRSTCIHVHDSEFINHVCSKYHNAQVN